MAESTDQSGQKIINNDYEAISDDDNEQHTQQQLALLSNEKTTTDENEQDTFSRQLRGAHIQIRIDDFLKCYIKITRHQIEKEENVTVKQEEEEEEEEEYLFHDTNTQMTLEQQIRERKEEEEKEVPSQEYPYKPSVIPKTQALPPKDNDDNRPDLNINN